MLLAWPIWSVLSSDVNFFQILQWFVRFLWWRASLCAVWFDGNWARCAFIYRERIERLIVTVMAMRSRSYQKSSEIIRNPRRIWRAKIVIFCIGINPKRNLKRNWFKPSLVHLLNLFNIMPFASQEGLDCSSNGIDEGNHVSQSNMRHRGNMVGLIFLA